MWYRKSRPPGTVATYKNSFVFDEEAPTRRDNLICDGDTLGYTSYKFDSITLCLNELQSHPDEVAELFGEGKDRRPEGEQFDSIALKTISQIWLHELLHFVPHIRCTFIALYMLGWLCVADQGS